jgi:hypothetical protein
VRAALRPIADPFVAAAPGGARVRTRLRVSAQDEAVLWAAGTHLGSLAGRDLAARCAEGRLDAKGTAVSRAVRKRALTAESSSRWAGAITRTSEDQYQRAERNLRDEQASLLARIRRIEARLAVEAGAKHGPTRGYATAAERHAKTIRLKTLRARLSRVQRRLDSGTMSVVRGGKDLLRKRNNLASAGLAQTRWRRDWEAARLFLTADGEAGKPWGNETIRVNPDEGWQRSSCPPRSRTWRTGRTAAAGCPARSRSATGETRSPPRRLPVPSATTSPTTRPGAGGISTRAGKPLPPPQRRWTCCGSTRSWPST